MKSNKTAIKNFLFIFILLSSLLLNLKAQTIRVNDVLDTESSFSTEELIENIAEESDEELDYTTLLENLNFCLADCQIVLIYSAYLQHNSRQ